MTNYQIDNRSWWVQRWLDLLDSYRFKKRLERARIYAREGNVLSIEFKEAEVLAKVQGSCEQPYQVSLSLDLFTDENWDDVIETMSEKAIFLAELLAGEMPSDIEQVFIANGLSLFPFNLSNIHSRCTCPDQANPCKHIGAVYYQLGDRFSEDPFILFQLRGRTRIQILEALRQKRFSASPTTHSLDSVKFADRELSASSKEATTVNIQEFWQYDQPLESSLVVIAPSVDNKTVIDILGTIPLPYADAEIFKQYVKQVYQTVKQQAMISALSS